MPPPLHQIPCDVPNSRSEVCPQQLMDLIEDHAIYVLDCAGDVLSWNRKADINKGYSKGQIVGRNFRMFFIPEDIAQAIPERDLAEAAEKGRSTGEGWRLRQNGDRFWASFVLTAMTNGEGRLIGFANVTRDLTERKRQEDAMLTMDTALREERDRMRAFAESSMDALFLCEPLRDRRGRVEDFVFTYLNKNVESLLNMPQSALIGRRLSDIPLNSSSPERMEQYRRVLETGEPFTCEFLSALQPTQGKWLRLQTVKLRDGLAITASDITSRKEYEERMRQRAERDPLTGVLSRGVLQSRLHCALQGAQGAGRYVGVLMLDLDGFKRINDSFGHSAGDQVLRAIAQRLQRCVRREDQIIRIGGDEFVIILPNLLDLSVAKALSERILESFQTPVAISGRKIRTSCSLGVAVSAGTGESLEQILSKAVAAMYVAKSLGRNCVSWDDTDPVAVVA